MSNPFEVRDPEIEAKLQDIGSRLRDAFRGTPYGFALLLFTFGEGGNMFYTANADRESVCRAMLEFIEKQMEPKP